ncbi:methionine--tRNA ligase [Prochlorococcus sp. MIT 1223]|uniref:methionine--tRNA ligase n=1 Tax=Prochlorococcus sp. MIT 1223 TaxID=3096217 RepID=UPI002A75937F|nr:methionine--tRNA ligase [Prochlorococcus sp. MIT 1223]
MSFTLTTPLYYVNDKPHLGSTYTTIACDALSRFYRRQSQEVIFITGVDEHGQKIERTAQSNNLLPQDHCDQIAQQYKNLWTSQQITFDRFIRTSSNSHKSLVHEFFKRVEASGDIRLGRQKGWYCVGCEEYKDIEPNDKNNEPECPIHLRKLEWRDEENLFFCLSNYQEKIEELVKKDSFIMPESRRNEVRSFVSSGLRDFSISRIDVNWGINVPGYPGHTFYVWFDALLGYLSGCLLPSKSKSLSSLSKNGWPASVHVIGKDILRFHAVYWPAMLMSANLALPEKVFGHGFLTREGKKMGKSLGNVLDPKSLIDSYGMDSVRWFLLRNIEFGKDGDFQNKRFIDTVNSDLANTIGNLLNRSTSMSRKWFENKTSKPDKLRNNIYMKSCCEEAIENYIKSFVKLDFKKAASEIITIASLANLYLNEQEPWKKIKNEDERQTVENILYDVLETCRIIGFLIEPLTPDLSIRILSQLSIDPSIQNWADNLKWGQLEESKPLPEPKPVMERIEIQEEL